MLLAISAIAGWGCAKDCRPVSDTPSNPSQSKALGDARARTSKYCTTAQARCRYHIEEDDDGSILVTTNFIYFQPELGGCVQAGDGIEDARYSKTGDFIRIEPQ